MQTERDTEMNNTRSPMPFGSKPPLDVLVMGSLFVELLPEIPGQSLVEMQRLIPTASGAAANFARALAALGVRVGMLTRVGDDQLGQWLRRQLDQSGIDAHGVVSVAGCLTPVSFASADLLGGKHFTFYRFPDYSDPMGDLSPTSLDARDLQRARLFDFTEAVIRQSNVRVAALQAAEWSRQAGNDVVYAVNYRAQSWTLPTDQMIVLQREALAAADVGLMNQEEYDLIFAGDDEAAAACGCHTLVVTAGECGGWILHDGRRHTFNAPAVEVQYDVGAGDSFHAGYVAAYLEGQPPEEAARFAAACAARKISQPACAPPPNRAEVQELLARG